MQGAEKLLVAGGRVVVPTEGTSGGTAVLYMHMYMNMNMHVTCPRARGYEKLHYSLGAGRKTLFGLGKRQIQAPMKESNLVDLIGKRILRSKLLLYRY